MAMKQDQQEDKLQKVIEAFDPEERDAASETTSTVPEDKEAKDMARLLMMAGRSCASREHPLFSAEAGWERFEKKLFMRQRKRRRYVVWTAVAATVLLWILSRFVLSPEEAPVTLFAAVEAETPVGIYCNGERIGSTEGLIDLTRFRNCSSDQYVIHTPVGENLQLLLPDSTLVALNAQSRLSYQYQPSTGLRTVALEGEGFFDVKRDTLHPFVIQVGNVKAEVLGTSFNIRNYEKEQLHITLLQGSLAVEADQQHRRIMKPGEDAELQTDGRLLVKETRTEVSVLWKKGYFAFDDVPLSELMREIGRWYNLNILAMNEAVASKRIHFKCKRSLEIHEIVDLLNELGGFDLVMKDHTIWVKSE